MSLYNDIGYFYPFQILQIFFARKEMMLIDKKV